MRPLILAALTLSLAGCSLLPGGFGRRGEPDRELPFDTDLARAEGDAAGFAVTARAGGAGLDELRESLRYEATRYCLLGFGTSRVTWVLDPASGDWALSRDGEGRAIARGRCADR